MSIRNWRLGILPIGWQTSPGFDSTSKGLRGAGQTYSDAQTGEAHGYLRTLALGFVILLILVVLGGAR